MLIINSFSMGETSAFMSKMLPIWYPAAKIITVTANTGLEDRKSLLFGSNVDRYLSLEAKLVEAVVHPENRKGTTHKLVTWDTAYFGFDIWESIIRKFGIFNIKYLHCTREMKERPIRSYLRSIGLRPRDYKIAVGIRADEADRVTKPNQQFIYPLMDRGVTKEDVTIGIEEFPFKLGIPARHGNCRVCPKKSLKKLMLNMQEDPSHFEETERLEREHGMHKQKINKPRVFFRGNTSTKALRNRLLALGELDPRFDAPESETGCAEQCLPFVGARK